MELNSAEQINVKLEWDYSGRKREKGTFKDEYEYTTETHLFHFNLYTYVEIENDDGDYWSPPTFDVVEKIIEITDLKVFDILDNPIILEEKTIINLTRQLEELVNYE